MSVYAISDLHLSLGTDKPMEVFGPSWDGYTDKIKQNWLKTVKEDDVVLMPGDLSWATYLDDTVADMSFIDELPGRKLICRGNHDYWWTTVHKMEVFFEEKGLKSIEIVRNNAIVIDQVVVSGTRGWKNPSDSDFSAQDRKIYDRELARMKLCIDAILKMDPEHNMLRVMMIHYPPITKSNMHTDAAKLLEAGQIDLCIYGHLHGRGHSIAFEGESGYNYPVRYLCASSDFVDFAPVKII